MKSIPPIILILLCWLPAKTILSQCQSIALVDSSFENITEFHAYTGVPEIGKWFYDDGVLSSNNAYIGNKSACSNGGGAFQFVKVDSQITYYVSAYILNGANDPSHYPNFRINWSFDSIAINSNDWTLVSTSFNSGSDTLAIIGFYGMGACFDEIRVTCDPLTSTDFISTPNKPYSLSSNFSYDFFRINSKEDLQIELWSIDGRLIRQLDKVNEYYFGSSLPEGMYLVKVRARSGLWVERIIKD